MDRFGFGSSRNVGNEMGAVGGQGNLLQTMLFEKRADGLK